VLRPNVPPGVHCGVVLIALTREEIIGLLSWPEVIAVVEAALRAKQEQLCVVPQRHHIEWQGNTFLAMPAVGLKSAGVKLVSVVQGNVARGLPVTNGLMVLNDAVTGVPLAVMNAGTLTAIRTGAVGALGVKYMTPRDTASVGIVGCGVQGTWQAIFACAVRPIREVFGLYRSPQSFERFVATLTRHAPGVRVVPCADARELLKCTAVVIAATTSPEPVLPDEPALLENRHFISVGSYQKSMQELPDSVYRLAGELAIDSESARHEVGDVIRALDQGFLKSSDVYVIGDLVAGRRSVNVERTTAYKTVGSALFDLFVAEALVEAAKRNGVGAEVAL
jgi:ornithine cyclodeaminase/alanine dehydrogenase-like protein (mu-crystallin family)